MEVLEEEGITAHTGTFGELFSSVLAITKTIVTIVAVRISVKYIWLLWAQQ